MLPIGSKAPEFRIRLFSGDFFRLRDLQDKSVVLITFFPHDFEKAESRETYVFLQHLQTIRSYGVFVLIITPKDVSGLKDFLSLYNLEIPIAEDVKKEICRNYRAIWLKGLALRKITYVIDRHGIIRGRLNHQLASEKSWNQISILVKELKKELDLSSH
jgi:peroxiredoxin